MATIEKNGTNYESELNNVDQGKWPSIKMSSTLETLNNVDSAYSKESFYKTNGEKVEYDIDSVKAYLKKLADTANHGEFVKEVNRGNWGLMNLAVQIALETLGYDVGKIDGLMGPKTKGKVKEFQRANGLSVDGVIGPKTAQKLLELLGGEPVTVEETDKEKIEKVEKNDKEVKKGEEVKAGDLVKNLPDGGTVEFKDGKGVDTSKEGEVEVTVVVKVGAEVREIVVKVTVVVEVVVETDKEKIEKVEKNDKKVKKGEEVKPGDLVKNLPDGGTVEFKDGKGVDTSKEGEVEVTVVVKVGVEVREIVVKVTVEVVVEETDKEKQSDLKEGEDGKKDSSIDNIEDRELTYGKVDCKYIPEYYPNKILRITNREDLKQFSEELYNKYDDKYFSNHDLAFHYALRTSTADNGYYIDNYGRSGNEIEVNYKKDNSGVGKIGGQIVSGEVLFVEINKGDTITWNEI